MAKSFSCQLSISCALIHTTNSVLKPKESVDAQYVSRVSKLYPIKTASLEYSQLIGLKEDYAAQRYDTERFFKSLRTSKNKFDVIAGYYKEDLFADINSEKWQAGPNSNQRQM